MDKKEFRTQLEQLADIELVAPRIMRIEDGQYDEVHTVEFDGETIEIERAFNPTLGVRMVRLKPRLEACELNCGAVVDRQVLEMRHYQTPEVHWRTRCATCGRYQHPDGGVINGIGTTISNTFNAYFKKRARQRIQNIAQSRPRE